MMACGGSEIGVDDRATPVAAHRRRMLPQRSNGLLRGASRIAAAGKSRCRWRRIRDRNSPVIKRVHDRWFGVIEASTEIS
jgi:hypothetical protein